MERTTILATVDFFFAALRCGQGAFAVDSHPRLQAGFELVDTLQTRAHQIDGGELVGTDLLGGSGDGEGVGSGHIATRFSPSPAQWERVRVRAITVVLLPYASSPLPAPLASACANADRQRAGCPSPAREEGTSKRGAD